MDEMDLVKTITAEIGGGIRWLAKNEGKEIVTGFHIISHYRHIVGERPPFGLTLARSEERSFRQCSGQFSPCDYLAVGPLVHVEQYPKTGAENIWYDDLGHKLVIDCGFPLDISYRTGERPPHIHSSKLHLGTWIATIGRVLDYGDMAPMMRCTFRDVSILDMRPESNTFGSVIPWDPRETFAARSRCIGVTVGLCDLRHH